MNINNLTTEERCQLIADLTGIKVIWTKDCMPRLDHSVIVLKTNINQSKTFHPKPQLKDDDVVMSWNEELIKHGHPASLYRAETRCMFNNWLPFDPNLAGKLLRDWPEDKLKEGKRNGNH